VGPGDATPYRLRNERKKKKRVVLERLGVEKGPRAVNAERRGKTGKKVKPRGSSGRKKNCTPQGNLVSVGKRYVTEEMRMPQ